MTTAAKSDLKFWASMLLPTLSILVTFIVFITKLDDHVGDISKDQISTHARLDLLDNKIDRLIHRVDTLANRQDKVGLFQQRWINGKLVFIPAK